MSAKAPSITDLRYIHDFTDREMDLLIQGVSFSDSISAKEKANLIGKIIDTASIYYETPFYDRGTGKLKFNPDGIFARTSRMAENPVREGGMDPGEIGRAHV